MGEVVDAEREGTGELVDEAVGGVAVGRGDGGEEGEDAACGGVVGAVDELGAGDEQSGGMG